MNYININYWFENLILEFGDLLIFFLILDKKNFKFKKKGGEEEDYYLEIKIVDLMFMCLLVFCLF